MEVIPAGIDVVQPQWQRPRSASRARPSGLPFVQWYAVAVLVLGSGAFFAVVAGPTDGSNPIVLGLWVVAYAVAAGLLADSGLRLRQRSAVPPEVLVFVLLAFASVAWSEAPVLSLRRAVGLTGTALIGVALAQRLGALHLLDALRRAMLIVAASSLLLYASGSASALDFIHGTLRGVVATKNSLGFFMALGLLACAAGALLDRRRARSCATAACPMLVALALTDSKTGLVVAGVVAASTGVSLACRSRRGALGAVVLVLIAAAAATVASPHLTLAAGAKLIGEDTTLTGRDAIWQESLLAAGAKPVLGHGYGAFWDGSAASGRIRDLLMWDVPHAHNGALDVLLDLGLLGVLSAGAVVLGLAARGLLDLKRHRRPQAAVRLPLAALIVTSNLVESNLLVQNNLMTVLLVAALVLPETRSAPEVDVGRSTSAGLPDDLDSRPVRPARRGGHRTAVARSRALVDRESRRARSLPRPRTRT